MFEPPFRIYLAGPDLFYPDADRRYTHLKRICDDHEIKVVLPYLGDTLGASEDIFHKNLIQMNACDAILANLTSFRGAEPDSGTVFEVGVAYAMSKPVFGYAFNTHTMNDRLIQAGYTLIHRGDRLVDGEGVQVENFNLCANLMLANAIPIYDCPEAAIGALFAKLKTMYEGIQSEAI